MYSPSPGPGVCPLQSQQPSPSPPPSSNCNRKVIYFFLFSLFFSSSFHATTNIWQYQDLRRIGSSAPPLSKRRPSAVWWDLLPKPKAFDLPWSVLYCHFQLKLIILHSQRLIDWLIGSAAFCFCFVCLLVKGHRPFQWNCDQAALGGSPGHFQQVFS